MDDSEMGTATGNLSLNVTQEPIYECTGATEDEMKLYYQLAWWMDGVVQVVMGLIGLAGNFIAIPVLLSKKLNRYRFSRCQCKVDYFAFLLFYHISLLVIFWGSFFAAQNGEKE